MAFPFVFEANFESGDASEWDSTADVGSQLDFPHYSELARFPWSTAAPYRGAYCMRATLSGGTADAYVQEGDLDIAAAATRYFRFAMWFSPDFTATANDTVNILELQSTGPVNEITFGFTINGLGVINFGIGETAPSSFTGFTIKKGVWYTIELAVTLDDGGSNDGTIDLYVTEDGTPANTTVAATQVASLNQGAVIQGRLGVQDHLATTTGTILFDAFAMDDARLYPTPRFPEAQIVTKSEHVFVGPGSIADVALLTSGGSNVVRLWDTDEADTVVQGAQVVELDQEQQTSFAGPWAFTRGCYAELTGTSPRAQVNTLTGGDEFGFVGPPCRTVANMRSHGLRR